MRYLTFSTASNPAPRLGAFSGGRIVDVAAASSGRLPGTLLAVIQQGADVQRRVSETVARLGSDGSVSHTPEEIRWHAPIPRPLKNVFCLGLNYVAHARESARMRGKEVHIPKVPVIFTKAPTSVTGPFDDIPVDWSATSQAIHTRLAGRSHPAGRGP